MRISPTYANRPDLSQAIKWHFTVEERVSENLLVRRVYRRYLSLPRWIDDALIGIFLVLALFPIMLISFLDWILGGDGEEGLGFMAYVVLVGAGGFFKPWAFVLIALLLPFCILLWWHHIMHDYAIELERAGKISPH